MTLNTDIVGINPASVASHISYCGKKGFGFTILSDPGRGVAAEYEAVKAFGKLIQRTVYVISPEGKIIFAEQGMPPNQKMMDAITTGIA